MVDNCDEVPTRLDELMTRVASQLMGVPRSQALSATNSVLDQIVEFFGVNDAFIRKHRPDRVSELVTVRPDRRQFSLGDLLQEMPFDEYPEVAIAEHLKEPHTLYADEGGLMQDHLRAQLDQDEFSFAAVPLLQDGETKGIMSLVRFSNQRWVDRELRTLFAIATLIAQFWCRLEAEEQLARRAYFDELTGLPNRHRLAQVIDEETGSQPSALLVHNMKAINDGLDYELGDRFLAGMAERLQQATRPDTLVGRQTGDQFFIYLPGSSEAEGAKLAERLVGELKKAIDLGDVKLVRSVSIGVAANDGADDLVKHDLLVEADAALHLAKREGKNTFRVFDHGMRQRTIERFEQEVELRRAIDEDEFTMHYQPAFDMQTNKIFAVEALLRWNHPKGMLAAGQFIETAEESGLVVEIGDFVLDAAIAQLSQWKETFPDLQMWINISPAQLMSRDLPLIVRDLLDHYRVPASRLCLELTEHMMLEDLQAVTGSLTRLQALGISLAVDDFGTGYSSMKQLRDLPFDCLKIDMTFVAGLGHSNHDEAIVEAALTLADSFGLATIAEGVETDLQVEELLKRGCTRAQGYLLARPTSPVEIERLLSTASQQSSVASL